MLFGACTLKWILNTIFLLLGMTYFVEIALEPVKKMLGKRVDVVISNRVKLCRICGFFALVYLHYK